jgi:hypothetical protein
MLISDTIWLVFVAFGAIVIVIGWVFAVKKAHQRKWRFSLRTLLIAMTLVAFALAWAAYASKNNLPATHQ